MEHTISGAVAFGKQEGERSMRASELPLRNRMELFNAAHRLPETKSRTDQLKDILDHYAAEHETHLENYSKAMSHKRSRIRTVYASRRPPAFFVRSEQAKAYLEMAKALVDPTSGAPFALNLVLKEELALHLMDRHSRCDELARAKRGKTTQFKKPKIPEGCFALLGRSSAYGCVIDYLKAKRERILLGTE
jgi:hypothetical protein